MSAQLDSLTARKQYSKGGLLYVEESSLDALQAFDSLRRDLRQLTQLPLDISAVYGEDLAITGQVRVGPCTVKSFEVISLI